MTRVIDRFAGPYDFLDNFFSSPFVYSDLSYPTVEHAFQASKTFDSKFARNIRQAETPRVAKTLGQRCPMRSDWEDIKHGVMLSLVKAKFEQNLIQASALLETGDAILIEGNAWHDTTWGRCHCVECGGVGANWLGKILMMVRDDIHYRRNNHFDPRNARKTSDYVKANGG